MKSKNEKQILKMQPIIKKWSLSIEKKTNPKLPTSDFRPRSNKHRVIALFFVCVFLQTLVPYNQLWANNNGPNAPEAASFEPVDATDMVNLLTGDLSYVLPLLNVPSPEGGYPLALSYHAGIAMDQEATWVGLGWSLNPGAINRSVNGYPDDWKNGLIGENFFDVGGEETTTSISTSYTSFAGGWTVGLSGSYNSNKGFGGSVSFGYGIPTGDGTIGVGASVGVQPGGKFNGSARVGYNSTVGFGFGASVSNRGVGISGGYNFGDDASSRLSAGLKSSFEGEQSIDVSFSQGKELKKNGIGLSFSSNGLSVASTVGGSTITTDLSFVNAISMNDYNVETDNESYAITFGTPIGIFSIGYNQQRIKWYLNSYKSSNVSGGLYLDNAIKYECRVKSKLSGVIGGNTFTNYFYVDTPEECDCMNFNSDFSICIEATLISNEVNNEGKYFMDVYEVGVSNGSKDLSSNNALLPAFDSFVVASQGLSGSIEPKTIGTKNLLGLPRDLLSTQAFKADYNIPDYPLPTIDNSIAPINFYFKNQHSSYLDISANTFDTDVSANKIYDYLVRDSGTQNAPRKRDGRFVQYYTLKQILEGEAESDGFMYAKDFDYENAPTSSTDLKGVPLQISDRLEGSIEEAIGGFKIVAPDGKTYHYSLPVFNLNTNSRIFGTNGKPQNESYFETTQGSYATHWLLTAVTGPDYVNRDPQNRNYPEEGDFGYWVRFDYGKWTDNYVWKLPYNEFYKEDKDDPNIKSNTYGRKQQFYLNRIKTRTHTAIFIKNRRTDNVGKRWLYKGFPAFGVQPTTGNYNTKFDIPSQNSLRLEKIVLVKNEDDAIVQSTTSSFATPGTLFAYYNDPNPPYDYNMIENIIDIEDDIQSTLQKAIKIVDFGRHYTYDLVNGTPNSNSGRLTLNGVTFLGKEGVQVMPPYVFEYENTKDFDFDKKDLWGYYKNDPSQWSLNKIINPTGATTEIVYESDDYDVVASENGRAFSNSLKFYFLPGQFPNSNTTPKKIRIRVEAENLPDSETDFILSDYFTTNKKVFIDFWLSTVQAAGPNTINSSIDIKPQYANIISTNESENSMLLEVNATGFGFNDYDQIKEVSPVSMKTGSGSYTFNQRKVRPYLASRKSSKEYSLVHRIIANRTPRAKQGGGLRVKEILSMDGINSYKNQYFYNQPGSVEDTEDDNYKSSGVISYLPFPENSELPLSYGSELPSPIPMYEYVTVKSGVSSATGKYLSKTRHKFKVLQEKETDEIIFGDLFEIEEETLLNNYNASSDKNVTIKHYDIKDNLSCLGQVLEIERYNNKGQLLAKTSNEYATSDEIEQGSIKESYQSFKEVNFDRSGTRDEWLINSVSKVSYPSVLKSTTVTQGGISATTTFNEHDYVSGQVLETTTTASDGQLYKTKITPAYHIDAYNGNSALDGMGPIVDDSSNKNMLTQTAATLQQVKKGALWKTMDATITTWKNRWDVITDQYDTIYGPARNIWRKHRTYTWKGEINTDGTFADYQGDFDDFNWEITSNNQPNKKWINTSTITRYDQFSMPLELMDINENKSSTKMGDNYTKVFAVSNAAYDKMFYSGAEDLYPDQNNFSGHVYKGTEANLTSTVHTGKWAIEVDTNQKAFGVRPAHGGKFKVSVWAYRDTSKDFLGSKLKIGSITLEPITDEIMYTKDWVQLNFLTPEIESEQEIYVYNSQGRATYDDFRVIEVGKSMTSYVYNDWGELSCILGSNNLGTRYEYNAKGQLTATYQEVVDQEGFTGGFKLSSRTKINYKGSLSVLEGSLETISEITTINCNTRFNITATGDIANWVIDFGDGSIEEGTSTPPNFLNHDYSTTGDKSVSLTLTDTKNNVTSFDLPITVRPEYYVSNEVQNGWSKTARINGTPGDPIFFNATANGSGDISGSFSINGVSRTLRGSVSNVPAGVFPSTGYVNCSVSVMTNTNSIGGAALSVKNPGNCGVVSVSVSTN